MRSAAIAVIVWIGMCLGGAEASGASIKSDFTTGDEGWRVRNADVSGDTFEFEGTARVPNYSGTGGNPGGHLWAVDIDAGNWSWIAPAKFLGNQSAYQGGTLSFSLYQISDMWDYYHSADVILVGGGLVLSYDAPHQPGETWTQYIVPLRPGLRWKRGEPGSGVWASEADFAKVMANLQTMTLRGEFIVGEDQGHLDTVKLANNPSYNGGFDLGNEGWRVVILEPAGPYTNLLDGPLMPHWEEPDGFPNPYLTFTDSYAGTWYWQAPAAILGELSAYYGGTMNFDLMQDDGGTPFNGADLVLVGGGLTLVYNTASNPGTDWTHYTVPLSPGAWRKGTLTGAVANGQELRQALASAGALRIRGEYHTEANIGALDEFTLIGVEKNSAGAWALYP